MDPRPLLRLALPALALWILPGCGEEAGGSSGWTCGAETDGWERCRDGVVEWCHAVGDPHFHAGRDCGRDRRVCVVGEDNLGYCALAADVCEVASAPGVCEDGAALNCVAGLRAERRCGVGRACVVEDGWAACVDR